MDSILSSKPQSYKQLLWRSLVLYRKSFSKIALISLALSIIVFIPRLMIDVFEKDFFSMLDPLSPHRLWMIVIEIISLMFFIAIIWHMHCVIRNKHEPLIEDFSVGAKKALYVFIAALLQSAIIFISGGIIYALLILLNYFQLLFINSLLGIILTTIIFFGQFILLLYVSTLFIFIIPLIAIENDGILRAIEDSISVVWNHWWRVFSTQVTPWIFYISLLILIKYALNIDINIYFTQKVYYQIWTTILNIALFTLFVPWVAALLLIQLKDLELRKALAPKRRPRRKK